MKRYLIVVALLTVFCAGCATFAPHASVITSKDQQWTIPAGTKFTATQLPKVKVPTEFVADEDLAVIYKGSLLELEQAADKRVIDTSRAAKTQGAVVGGLGALLTIGASLVGKFAWNKVTNKTPTPKA